MQTYGETPSTLHILYNATPATHVSAFFAAAARSSCIVGQIEATSISDASYELPPIAMVQLVTHVSYVRISAEVCKQLRDSVLLVWRSTGWNYGGLLIGQKTTKNG